MIKNRPYLYLQVVKLKIKQNNMFDKSTNFLHKIIPTKPIATLMSQTRAKSHLLHLLNVFSLCHVSQSINKHPDKPTISQRLRNLQSHDTLIRLGFHVRTSQLFTILIYNYFSLSKIIFVQVGLFGLVQIFNFLKKNLK